MALVSLAQVFVTLIAVFASHVTMSNSVARMLVPFLIHIPIFFYTNGQGSKPHSPEYLANIQFIVVQIKKFVSVVEKFYAHDGVTA